jgi:chaperonin GroES
MKAKKNLIVVGPRVLVSFDKSENRTDAGLYLPPTVKDKEDVFGGYIVKTGPGYPIHDSSIVSEEPWAASGTETRYLPLEAKEGDYALFLRKDGVEIQFEGDKYLIVPHSAILALVRTEIVEE